MKGSSFVLCRVETSFQQESFFPEEISKSWNFLREDEWDRQVPLADWKENLR